MDHPLIKEAMTEMFDPILDNWKGSKVLDPTGLLLCSI